MIYPAWTRAVRTAPAKMPSLVLGATLPFSPMRTAHKTFLSYTTKHIIRHGQPAKHQACRQVWETSIHRGNIGA